MGFKCGIVGLPNVGKSTLFNALTETAAAQAANYPFCTIEPNVGDVAVRDGVIVAVGPQKESVNGDTEREIDATGLLVTPGFVDLHTHYDGQAIWSERLTPSSAHGVTTVVMGNCGVGFAPCRQEDHDVLVDVMAGVEDIPGVVMTDGLPWSWETFPEYMDALDAGKAAIPIRQPLRRHGRERAEDRDHQDGRDQHLDEGEAGDVLPATAAAASVGLAYRAHPPVLRRKRTVLT